jgi:hypothetical protein
MELCPLFIFVKLEEEDDAQSIEEEETLSPQNFTLSNENDHSTTPQSIRWLRCY